MKCYKKILIVCVTLVLLVLPAAAFADNFEGSTGTVRITDAWSASDRFSDVVAATGVTSPSTQVVNLYITANGTLSEANGDRAFFHTSNIPAIEIVEISDSVNYNFTNPGGFLNGFQNLKSVTLGLSIISSAALSNNPNLESVTLENATQLEVFTLAVDPKLESISLPNVTTIGNSVFQDDTGLTSVYLPKCAEFGYSTFSGCTQPIELTLGSTVPTIVGYGVFDTYNPLSKGATVYVPAASIDAYDADLTFDTSGGTVDDGLWYGWTIEEIPIVQISNPQTGDLSLFQSIIEWFDFK